MEALGILQEVARRTGEPWHGQWDGRYVCVVPYGKGPAAETEAMRVGSVTRYRCGAKDVLVLEPSSGPISGHVSETLRELRLLPVIGATGIVVEGPRHVLESAVARMSLRGIRARIHGRQLRVAS
jgi:hypothetical protein